MSVLKKGPAQKLNLQDMTANKLIVMHTAEGASRVQQEDQAVQMSMKSSHQTSNQEKKGFGARNETSFLSN